MRAVAQGNVAVTAVAVDAGVVYADDVCVLLCLLLQYVVTGAVFAEAARVVVVCCYCGPSI